MLRWAGQGIHAYLSEPVSAFSVADCPGTAFRRAHTRTSSSRCAVSCRKGKDRLLPLWLHGKQAHPHWGNSQPALQQVDRRRGDRERGSWRWTLTHLSSHRRPRAPFPVDGCHLYLVLSKGWKDRACPSASPRGTETKGKSQIQL